MTELIIRIGVIYFILSFCYLIGSGSYAGHHYFNPIDNYEEWDKLNLFGVLVFTLLINILFAPCAMIYWVFKILVAMFTVGRR
jgi:uncharacterized membrane protein